MRWLLPSDFARGWNANGRPSRSTGPTANAPDWVNIARLALLSLVVLAILRWLTKAKRTV